MWLPLSFLRHLGYSLSATHWFFWVILSHSRCKNRCNKVLGLEPLLWETLQALLYKIDQMRKSIGFQSLELAGHSKSRIKNGNIPRRPLLCSLTGVSGGSVLLERLVLIPELALSPRLQVLLGNIQNLQFRVELSFFRNEKREVRPVANTPAKTIMVAGWETYDTIRPTELAALDDDASPLLFLWF